jgi:epsin
MQSSPTPGSEYSGGGSSSGFRDNTSRRTDFEEYDAGDDETSARRTASAATSQTRSPTTQSKATGKAPETVPAPVMNLLDFDDEPAAGSSAATATEKALPALAPLGANENGASLLSVTTVDPCQLTVSTAGGEDDFADFQAAPSSPPTAATITTKPLAASPVTAAAAAKPNLMDLLASTSSPAMSKPVQSFGTLNAALAAPSSQVRPSSTPATAPAYAGMPAMTPTLARSAVASPVSTASSPLATTSTKRGGGFDDLWTMSLGSTGASRPAAGAAGAKSIRDLEKEKAQAGIWGTQNQTRPLAAAAGAASFGGGFGSFVKPAGPSNNGGGAPAGADDLLL